MLLRLLLFMLIGVMPVGSGQIIHDNWPFASRETPILLPDDPLSRANAYLQEDKLEEAIHLARFSAAYLPVSMEYSATEIEDVATKRLNSSEYLFESFYLGAVTGEPRDISGLAGTLSIDMLILGDIRDLVVQGYREYETGQGDEVLIALSAAGLLLSMAPQASWAPSLFKVFWRGKRFSKSFQEQLVTVLTKARQTGDYRAVQTVLQQFRDVVANLGVRPTMTLLPAVKSTDELARLARKVEYAPEETYTLVSMRGIRSLDHISNASPGAARVAKRVKVFVRQQKIFGKILDMTAIQLRAVSLVTSILVLIWLLARRRKAYARKQSFGQ